MAQSLSTAQVANPNPQQPGIVFVSVSGASGTLLDEQNQWTIFGGIQRLNGLTAGAVGCTDTTSPCNTCQGRIAGGVSYPCNLTGVFPETRVIFNLQLPANATGRILLCVNNQTVAESLNVSVPLTATWSQICGATTPGNSSTCDNDFNVTYQLGTGNACNALAAGSINLRFIVRGIDLNNTSTYAPAATPDACGATNTHGACYFSLFPGDKKTYLEELGLPSSFPSTPTSSVRYSSLIFFSEPTNGPLDDTSSDVAAFTAITTQSPSSILNLTADGNPDGSVLDGLENDVRYCFKMGSVDQAGNIERISSADCTGAADCARVCMAPSEVLGLLSDKQCFIATAAYGSPLDPHVNRIREFRDRFLIPNWFGRRLVKAYYKISPPLANWIKKHDSARVVIRGLLWPVLGWVHLSLMWGWWGVVFPGLVLLGVILGLRRRSQWG